MNIRDWIHNCRGCFPSLHFPVTVCKIIITTSKEKLLVAVILVNGTYYVWLSVFNIQKLEVWYDVKSKILYTFRCNMRCGNLLIEFWCKINTLKKVIKVWFEVDNSFPIKRASALILVTSQRIRCASPHIPHYAWKAFRQSLQSN